MWQFLGLIYLFFVAVAAGETASNKEELKKNYMKIMEACIEEASFTPSEIEALQKKTMPTPEKLNCFFACAFKKTGLMDEKGFLSIEGVRASNDKFFEGNPDGTKISEEFIAACKGVNDVPVKDGGKGCERAGLIYKCSIENTPNLNFV